MDYEEYKRKALEPIVSYIESVMASYSKEELEDRIKKALPEKESEDERIRKEIQEYFNQFCDRDLRGVDISDWIAWLEKQKEQKPAEKPDLVSELREHLVNTPKEQLEKEWKELEPWGNIGPTVQEFLYGKPAEWSEEDEKILRTIISDGSRGVELDSKQIAWLKSLRPQQKQEVVDRNVFYRIADILRWCVLPIGCPVENFKQSESEREHLLYTVQCVAHRYANQCTYCKEYSRGYQDGLAIHHWKPSEEQISALERAIVKMHTVNDIGILAELRDNLKKL